MRLNDLPTREPTRCPPRRWQPPSNCWNVFGTTVTLMPLSQPTAATRRILTRPRFSRLARPWSKVQACSRLVARQGSYLILQKLIGAAEGFDSRAFPMIVGVSLRARRWRRVSQGPISYLNDIESS